MNVPTNLVDVHNVPVHHLTGWITVDVTQYEASVGEYFTNYKFSTREEAEQFINDCKLKLWHQKTYANECMPKAHSI